MNAYPSPVQGLAGWSVQDAVEWIRDHYVAFQELGGRIVGLQARAADVEAQARTTDPDRADAAAVAAASLDGLRDRWRWAADQMRWVAEHVPGLGLGQFIVPIVVSSVALVVVVAALKVMKDYDAASRVIDLLEQGRLSVDQAKALGLDVSGTPFVSFGGGLTLAVVLAGAAWWWGRSRAH